MVAVGATGVAAEPDVEKEEGKAAEEEALMEEEDEAVGAEEGAEGVEAEKELKSSQPLEAATEGVECAAVRTG